jgi:hypothetical protein
MIEKWRDIPGYKGSYQVSDRGRVRSVRRYIYQLSRQGVLFRRLLQSRILKPAPHRSGHLMVMLGRHCNEDVHVLVLRAFRGPRPKGKESLHKNHKPWDNKLSNLKYGTRGENISVDFQHGRRKTHPNFNRWGYVYD